MNSPASLVLVFALAPGAPGGDAVLAEASARARRGPPPEAAAAYLGVSFTGRRRILVPAGEPALERLPQSPAVTLTEESLDWLSPQAAPARRTLAQAVVLRALALDLGERAYERALQDPALSTVPRLAAVAERLKEYERGPRGLKNFAPRLEPLLRDWLQEAAAAVHGGRAAEARAALAAARESGLDEAGRSRADSLERDIRAVEAAPKEPAP